MMLKAHSNCCWRTRAYLRAALVGAALAAAPICASAQPAAAGPPPLSTLKLETGKEIYEAGCVNCHGPDGKGQPRSQTGFEMPPTAPDFSDCPTSTAEPDVQWRAIITNGGPARGFSRIMPSYKDLLTAEQIDKVVAYLRGFCTEPVWPRGDLNLPRPLVTEKAFPENETVLTSAINAQGAAGVGSTVIYERRIGSSAMVEAIIPYDFTKESGAWGASFGDLALGYKQKLYHDVRKGTIFSAGGEIIAPTGNTTLGTGGESTVLETFAAFGQLFPRTSFLQVHTGIELPAHTDKVSRAYYLRTAVGKTFAANAGLGRRWSPMVELIADRELVSGATTNWDVVPQLQIPINKRMHLLGNLGMRLPANNRDERPRQVLFYVLWDWVDGGLLQGW
jgi:mono/diheme cytochrome c family protein